jgi:hypothetical protein
MTYALHPGWGPPLDVANVPENPLNSFRMSMLAHGFTHDDPEDPDHWVGDANPWIRPDTTSPYSALDIAIGVVVAVVAMAIVVLLL